jgi:hypothetical protein
VRPSSDLAWASHLRGDKLNKAVYQVSTPRLTGVTSQTLNTSCGAACCGHDMDHSQMRIGGSCAASGQAGFGLIDIDVAQRQANFKIMRSDGGGVVIVDDPFNPVALEFAIDLQLCMNSTTGIV